MTYRVFDTGIGKLFGAFDNEASALELADTLIGNNDDNFADDLAIGHERPDGTYSEPLTGIPLLARIRELSLLRESVVAGQPSPDRS